MMKGRRDASQPKNSSGYKNPARPRTFRETVQFYMIDFKTPLGKSIDIAIIFLNLLLVAIFVTDTYDISSSQREMLWNLEIFIVGIFIIEYILRLYGASNRLAYVRDIYSIIDLVAILPTLLLLALSPTFFSHNIRAVQTIRVLAVFRIFRFLRFIAQNHLFFGIISHRMVDVARLVMTIIIIFFVYSGLFYSIENPLNNDVKNFGDSFYFTVVTASTVGFGDIVPVTQAGRLVAVAMIISSIIIIPFQAARIFRAWVMAANEKIMLICPNCGQERHDRDAKFCSRCGEKLPESR